MISMDNDNITGKIYLTSGQLFDVTPGKRDREIITKFNNIVTDNDTVIHCGNFGNPDTVKYLNGKTHYLILGEQEHEDMGIFNSFDEYYDVLTYKGFTSVYENFMVTSKIIDGKTCVLHDGYVEILDPIKDNPTLMRRTMISVDVNPNGNHPVYAGTVDTKYRDLIKNAQNEESGGKQNE